MGKAVILIKESFLCSVGKDLFSFLTLGMAMYFNYRFCDNSKIMSGFFIVLFLLKAVIYYKDSSLTIDQTRKKLDNLEKNNK